ncbi:SAM-dependent methyltransferase [Lentilactobacillus sp. SPB1-3]|uniref:SAM-dependent methyltransferase n=1 Tax=Lentilactobacillus terminaliae TaxID=3003483 RepID=A0ACD5DEP6_9LACO|nr:SAM-dependent methyltransferase [Lentilactobacillus sp. SPB1-3]MCZ0977526.1 SAM-dependent methyltransferase [Lentilactobacillus sp. SPB1-3]
MLSNKQKKKLLKKHSQAKPMSKETDYISKLNYYRELYTDVPEVVFLINNILQSDRLIKAGMLPQDLPELILPDDIQDQIFAIVNAKYAKGDPAGDHLWNQLTNELPKADKLLRSYRDYLEETYGMWAYISAPFVKAIADYVGDAAVLEVMAGNGYISRGLQNLGRTVYPTDSLAWETENQTGNHQVIDVEKLDAISAIQKYSDKVKYVIMSWSPDKDTIDMKILNEIRNANHNLTLIVIGEKNGATNSTEFWQQANFIDQPAANKLNEHHQPFDLIKDQVYLVD